MKVVLAHNCDIRNNGTATYALRSMKMIGEERGFEVVHQATRGTPKPADWYLHVDDGRDDIAWLPPRPNAYWAVDTHLGYAMRVHKARHFDRVFVAQKDAVQAFKNDGVKWVEWLPLACQPEAHSNKEELTAKGFRDLERSWDISFVGFLNNSTDPSHNNRIDYLDAVFSAIKNSWFSANCFFEDMAIRYVKARVGFNVSIKRDLNMRTFEVMSTGTPLLTNRSVEGIDDLFNEGDHYVGYEGPQEAVEQAKWMLDHQDEADAIGRHAHELVRSKHTYKHRMQVVVDEMAKVA